MRERTQIRTRAANEAICDGRDIYRIVGALPRSELEQRPTPVLECRPSLTPRAEAAAHTADSEPTKPPRDRKAGDELRRGAAGPDADLSQRYVGDAA
jgi:hypothetical protein